MNIDEHWTAFKNTLFSGAAQVVGRVPMAFFIAASDCERDDIALFSNKETLIMFHTVPRDCRIYVRFSSLFY